MAKLQYNGVDRDVSIAILREINHGSGSNGYGKNAWLEEVSGVVYVVGRYTESEYKRALRNVRNVSQEETKCLIGIT